MKHLKLLKNKELNPNNIKNLWDHYQTTIKSRPNYGRLGHGGITITLPQSMCWEWANKCAGDSGGDTPRPVGIRLEPGVVKRDFGTQDNAMSAIWDSPESLEDAIRTYGGGGAEHLAQKMARKKIKEDQLEKRARLGGFDHYSEDRSAEEELEDERLKKMCIEILAIAIEHKDISVIKQIINEGLDRFKTSQWAGTLEEEFHKKADFG